MNPFFRAEGLRAHTAVIATLLLAAATLVAACDNPVDHDDNDSDHSEAHGLLLLTNGTELVRVQEGQVGDTLFVTLNDQTPLIEVEFLDEEGDHIHAEDLGDDFSLQLTIEDPGIAEADVVGDWSFTVTGLSQDTTALVVELFHLDEHPDFTTPKIPMVVR